jgi:kinesin family protein 2/24
VYAVTVAPLVHTLFNNGKATCFAYGQTGSGKTYTMSPLPIRAAGDILDYLQRLPDLRDVELCVSCFEIYGNKVFDLLNMRKKLNILEDGKKKVCVVGLKVSRRRTRTHRSAGATARLAVHTLHGLLAMDGVVTMVGCC